MTMAIETHFDTSKRKLSPDEALVELYNRLHERNTPQPGSFTALGGDDRRAYFRQAKQRSRAAQADALAAGKVKPTAANIRAALADAALMLLAANGPGADHVRTVLSVVFIARPGVPLTVEKKARSGKLRPRLMPISGGN